MRIGVFILFFLFCFQTVFADSSIKPSEALSTLVRLQVMQQLNGVKTFGDLVTVNLRKTDQDQIASDIKNYGLSTVEFPKVEYRDGKLVVGEIVLGFEKVSDGYIVINDRNFDLTKPLAYQRAKLLIDELLPKEKSNNAFLNFALPFAHASDGGGRNRTRVSAAYLAVGPAPTLEEMRAGGVTVTDYLLAYYRQRANHLREAAQVGGFRNDFYLVNTFSCRGSSLLEVRDSYLVVNGSNQRSSGSEIVFRPTARGGTITSPSNRCSANTDARGRVVSSTSSRCSSDYLRNFENFPPIARACCSEQTCYTRVTGELVRIRQTFVRRNGNRR